MEQQQQHQEQHHQEHHQNRRLRPPEQPENLNQQPQQPQKCPRCESINTKFCYYNNYSLSQPRYFCKTCRRYWTQGGTLRNVPVGGGCRKGKRPKTTSSSSSSAPPPPPPQPQTIPETANPALNSKEFGNLTLPPAIPPVNSYFSGGGFLSSVAAIQSMTQSQAFNQQSLNVGGGGGGQFGSGSNLALLQGFNVVPSFGSRQGPNQQIQNPNEFFQMGNNNRDKNIEPLYPSDQSLVQPNRPLAPWNQNLMINTTTNPTTESNPNPSFMNPPGTSMNPNQWPDLQGFDSPM